MVPRKFCVWRVCTNLNLHVACQTVIQYDITFWLVVQGNPSKVDTIEPKSLSFIESVLNSGGSHTPLKTEVRVWLVRQWSAHECSAVCMGRFKCTCPELLQMRFCSLLQRKLPT